MTTHESLIRRSFVASLLLVGLVAVCGPAAVVAVTDAVANSGVYFRMGSSLSDLVPVAAGELKPGNIYNYFNPRLGRRAWGFYQANGQLGHAFGAGTTQPARLFDLRITRDEGLERLRSLDPAMAEQIGRTGDTVILQLNDNNKWTLLRGNSVASVYDIETNQRWEQQFARYIPVVHTGGNCWIMGNTGKYLPAGSY